MSKMMIVAATSEKMLELMDKITIEDVGSVHVWYVPVKHQKVIAEPAKMALLC